MLLTTVQDESLAVVPKQANADSAVHWVACSGITILPWKAMWEVVSIENVCLRLRPKYIIVSF